MPEIITTGESKKPIAVELLSGEPEEAVRAGPRNKTIAAANFISTHFDFPAIINQEIARQSATKALSKLGMGENASRIVDAALKSTSGIGVTFTTKFLEPGRIDGPREFVNFQPFDHSAELVSQTP